MCSGDGIPGRAPGVETCEPVGLNGRGFAPLLAMGASRLRSDSDISLMLGVTRLAVCDLILPLNTGRERCELPPSALRLGDVDVSWALSDRSLRKPDLGVMFAGDA